MWLKAIREEPEGYRRLIKEPEGYKRLLKIEAER